MPKRKNNKRDNAMTMPSTQRAGDELDGDKRELKFSDLIDDEELRNLFPPRSAKDLEKLYQDLDKNGLEDAIDVDRDSHIVDGYNRFDWARNRYPDGNVPGLNIRVRTFPDREAEESWIINRQFERRNLNAAQRLYSALKLKPQFAAKAKQNQRRGKGPLRSEDAEFPVDALRSVAELAGVSRDSAAKVEDVLGSGSQEIIDRMLNGEMSINAAHKAIKGNSNDDDAGDDEEHGAERDTEEEGDGEEEGAEQAAAPRPGGNNDVNKPLQPGTKAPKARAGRKRDNSPLLPTWVTDRSNEIPGPIHQLYLELEHNPPPPPEFLVDQIKLLSNAAWELNEVIHKLMGRVDTKPQPGDAGSGNTAA